MAALGKNDKTIGDINITPLTDVFLVLLVVIIIAAPALSRARGGISSPEVNQAVALKSTWLVANVEKDGTIYVDGSLVAAEDLHGVLSARVETAPERVIVVRGDREAQSGVILQVLRTAKEAGFVDGFIAGQITRIETGAETP